MNKTNAMRLLDQAHIAYKALEYQLSDEEFSGLKVAKILNIKPEACFKTLALKCDHELFILCIPVAKEIALKKAAKACKVKHLELLHTKDLLKEVGYVRGTTTPVGILKKHRVYFDESVLKEDMISISGGRKGLSLYLSAMELLTYLKAETADLCEEEKC